MQVDIVETYTEFEKLKLNWDAVYEADPEAQFFLSWTWLSQVFSHHQTGWFILAIKPDGINRDYIAFFPLRLKTRMSNKLQEFYNEIRVAGTFFWADYSGFICRPDYDEEAIPCLSSQLKQMHWREIYLKNILISDKRLEIFVSQFDNTIFSHSYLKRISKLDNIDRLVCPYVVLPDEFETYLTEKLSANTRQKIRRFMRKIENSDDLTITYSVPETYERDLDILINFWRKKWATRKGREIEHLAKIYRKILQQGLENNTLYMPILWRGERPLGALGSFIDRQKKSLLHFVAGRDESCVNLPPGLILHVHSIRWAIENGLKTYDFLRGNESFKYSYGAIDRRIRYLLLSTRSGANLNRTLDPGCLDDVLKKATRYQRSGWTEKAKIGFQQILEIRPEDMTVLRRYGRLLYQNGDSSKAKNIYLKLLEIDQNNIVGWLGLGKSLLALNRYVEAETVFRKMIELNPVETISARYYLGCALQGRNMKAAAATEFTTVSNLEPRDIREKKKQRNARKYYIQCTMR
jgi:hypothetical protein